MISARLLFASLACFAGLFLSSCATPVDSRDPAVYRPAPAHYPPLP